MQRAASAPNSAAFTVATPAIRPSAGVLLIRSSTLRRRRWAAIASDPVFNERAVVDKLRDVFPRRALIGLAPAPPPRAGRFAVERIGVARDQFGEIGTNVIEIDGGLFGSSVGGDVGRLEKQESARPASASRRPPLRFS